MFDISLSPQTRSPAPKSESYIREYLSFGLYIAGCSRLKWGSVLERRADIRLSCDFVFYFHFWVVFGYIGHSIMKRLNDSIRPTN